MGYATLMVHLALGRANQGPLRIAADIAARFNARVIGITACQPVQVAYAEGDISGEIFEQNRDELEKEVAVAEREFRAAMTHRALELQWRSAVTFASLAEHLSAEARSADLLIIGGATAGPFDATRAVDPADLVVNAGRPVLVIPPGVRAMKLDRMLIGWRDTREARRAVSDALPLLARATQVTVVEMAPDDESGAVHARLGDVTAWLRSHDIKASALFRSSIGEEGDQLNRIAAEQEADLVIAGAYGHSRMREWVLGGVTRGLLRGSNRCALVSH